MTNEQIIADVAISAGIYTLEEIENFIESGREIPLHTFKGWTTRGNYKIKAGEHGIETRLWKKKEKKNNKDDNQDDSEESNNGFYLAKAYLFSADQVELKEDIKCAI